MYKRDDDDDDSNSLNEQEKYVDLLRRTFDALTIVGIAVRVDVIHELLRQSASAATQHAASSAAAPELLRPLAGPSRSVAPLRPPSFLVVVVVCFDDFVTYHSFWQTLSALLVGMMNCSL